MGMSSTDDLLREVEGQTGRSDRETGPDARQRSGRLASLRGRAGRVFSPRGFLLALVTFTVGVGLAGVLVPPSVPLGGLLGVFVAGFGLGLVDRRRYVEVGFAGAAVSGVALLADYLAFSLLGGFGPSLAAFGAAAGALVALVGHYFGRDLRSGLTRDLS